MTKMQIIAKTALTVLGINAIIILLRQSIYVAPPLLGWQQALSYVLLICLIITIARLFIFNNDSMAVRITGAGEKLSPNGAASFLVCSYRIGLVSYGLISLCSSTLQFSILIDKLNPKSIRMWINYIINDGLSIVDRCREAIYVGRNSLIVILTIYLIIGAPHFIRGQARRLLSRNYQPEIEEYDKNE